MVNGQDVDRVRTDETVDDAIRRPDQLANTGIVQDWEHSSRFWQLCRLFDGGQDACDDDVR